MDGLSVVSIDTTDTLGDVTQNLDGSFTYDGSVAFAALGDGETAVDSFKYTVDDGRGGTSTATVNVTITGVSNQAPVAALETSRGDHEAINGLDLEFDASCSFDPDGTIAEYQFDFGDGTTLISANPTVSHTYTSTGDVTATLVVIDNNGAASTHIDFDINVREADPLVASFTTDPTPLLGIAPFTIEATNTSTSADTTIVSISWDAGDGSPDEMGFGDVFTHTYGSPAAFTLFMQITDELGRVASTSTDVNVALF